MKSADETTVEVGEPITYHVTVTNTGVPTLTGITVDDPNGPDCEQAVPDLTAGQAHTIDCTYTTIGADAGTYENTATVDTDQTAPVASNQVDVEVTEAPAPALSVVKSADQTHVEPGAAIDYHLVITNTGNVALTGITVDDPNAPDCEQAVPDLAAGEDHTVDCSYTTTVADYPSRANTATVDSDQTAPVDSNEVTVAVGFASRRLRRYAAGVQPTRARCSTTAR